RNQSGWYNATAGRSEQPRDAFRASTSYVTGTHNGQVGVDGTYARLRFFDICDDAKWISVTTVNGLPFLGIANFLAPGPRAAMARGFELGLYAQDQWAVKRFTVNAGVRFDRISGWYPDQTVPASTWVGPRSATEQTVFGFKDFQPRL